MHYCLKYLFSYLLKEHFNASLAATFYCCMEKNTRWTHLNARQWALQSIMVDANTNLTQAQRNSHLLKSDQLKLNISKGFCSIKRILFHSRSGPETRWPTFPADLTPHDFTNQLHFPLTLLLCQAQNYSTGLQEEPSDPGGGGGRRSSG